MPPSIEDRPARHVEPLRSLGTSQKPDYSTWLTKQQAADAIGCSTKTIEQLARDQHLQQGLWRPLGRGALRAVYHPDDVARVATARRGTPAPFVVPAVPPSNGNNHGALAHTTPVQPGEDGPPEIPEWLQHVGAVIWRVASEKAATSQNSEKSRPWMTTAEIARAWRWPRANVAALIAAGTLGRIFALGPESRRRYVVRRSAVEAFAAGQDLEAL